ncbi:MAG TPA: hypothetical protein VGI66_17565 [Streptosporangiaceae bacterium]
MEEDQVIRLPRKAPQYRIRMTRWRLLRELIRGGHITLPGSAVSPLFGIGLGGGGGEYSGTFQIAPDVGQVRVTAIGGGGASGGSSSTAGSSGMAGGGGYAASRGGNGRNGDGTWQPTDGQGCSYCGAYGGGGHGGGCPNASA